jgi:1-acyl-sn-glycerol-3-phosphate acyltransferase
MRFFYIYKNLKLIYLLRQLIRAALWLFCAEIKINNKSLLTQKGPLLIIANHPNSFLDAIIIGSLYNRSIHFLARGDVFTKKHHRFLLSLLNMIPVYRIREGKEFLHLNQFAFDTSVKLLNNNEAVLIFIEGICVNKNELQPFKKGTARIVEAAQQAGCNPIIHLAGIAYNNFRGIGKRVNINLDSFYQKEIMTTSKDKVEFNKQVFNALDKLITPPTTPTRIKKTPLYYLYQPLYRGIEKIADHKTKGTVFFDSVLFGLLFFGYPVYIFLITTLLLFMGISLPIIIGTLVLVFLLRNKTLGIKQR